MDIHSNFKRTAVLFIFLFFVFLSLSGSAAAFNLSPAKDTNYRQLIAPFKIWGNDSANIINQDSEAFGETSSKKVFTVLTKYNWNKSAFEPFVSKNRFSYGMTLKGRGGISKLKINPEIEKIHNFTGAINGNGIDEAEMMVMDDGTEVYVYRSEYRNYRGKLRSDVWLKTRSDNSENLVDINHTKIIANPPASSGIVREMEIGETSDGKILVVWRGSDEDDYCNSYTIFIQMFSKSGQAQSGVFQISGSSECSLQPDMEVLEDGKIVIIWYDLLSFFPYMDSTIKSRVIDIPNSSISPIMSLSSEDPPSQGYVHMAQFRPKIACSNNRCAVSWFFSGTRSDSGNENKMKYKVVEPTSSGMNNITNDLVLEEDISGNTDYDQGDILFDTVSRRFASIYVHKPKNSNMDFEIRVRAFDTNGVFRSDAESIFEDENSHFPDSPEYLITSDADSDGSIFTSWSSYAGSPYNKVFGGGGKLTGI